MTKLNKVSSIRTFEETSARWFWVDGDRIGRRDLEEWPYERLKKMIKKGKVKSEQRF